jgi:hypothetical protein
MDGPRNGSFLTLEQGRPNAGGQVAMAPLFSIVVISWFNGVFC